MQTLVASGPAAPIARAIEPAPAGSAILALDLGTTTGWAIRTAEGVILSGTVSFRPSRYDGGGMRYLRFRAWLEELAEDAGGLSAIWFEEVRRHLGTDASHVYRRSARDADRVGRAAPASPTRARRSARSSVTPRAGAMPASPT